MSPIPQMFMAMFCNHRLRAVSLFSWCIEQNARDTQMTTRVTEGPRRERHEKREAVVSFFFSGLMSRGRSTLARAKSIHIKSEEKERLLAVYHNQVVWKYLCTPQ